MPGGSCGDGLPEGVDHCVEGGGVGRHLSEQAQELGDAKEFLASPGVPVGKFFQQAAMCLNPLLEQRWVAGSVVADPKGPVGAAENHRSLGLAGCASRYGCPVRLERLGEQALLAGLLVPLAQKKAEVGKEPGPLWAGWCAACQP